MLAEGHRVAIDGLPAGQAAFAAIEQLPDLAGGTRDRIDRRGRLRFDHVWLHAPTFPPTTVDAAGGLAERDLRWLAERPRRGRRVQELAAAAVASGLFRVLYELDTSTARFRLGQLRRIEPRPEAQPALAAWLTRLNAVDADLTSRLVDALPPTAKAWAAHEAPRLIAAAAPSSRARAALADGLCALAACLPADGLPLSVLAERAVHRTHGLDTNTTLGRLGARLAAAIGGLPPPTVAADIREVWEAVGVWIDRLSSQVAGWQLPLHPSHPAAPVAAAYQAAGEPALLTLGIIAASHAPLIIPPAGGGTIWVVEGISALTAAAARRVPAPVVCRGGTPSVAVTRLVRAGAAAGWRIAVSSDFEPGGLHGAAALLRQVGPAGQPWRLSAADYLTAPTEGNPFDPDQVPETPWDPALAAAMRRRRQRVSEEARLDNLLGDLEMPLEALGATRRRGRLQTSQRDDTDA
jgi:uncharacterized protein (TIGR02679 family)